MKMTSGIKYSRDNEEGLLYIIFNDNDYEVSEEFETSEGQRFVIDLDKKGKIKGIEVFDYEN